MPEQPENKAVERSCWLFQRLLVFYPRAHREEYGLAILQLFRDQCRDAWASRQSRGLIGFWFHAFADLLKTSILEHLSNLNRNKSMLKYFRPQFTPFPIFFRIFGGVFLFVLLASVMITFLSPEMFASMARIDAELTSVHVNSEETEALHEHMMQMEFEAIKSHTTLSKVNRALNLSAAWGGKI